MYRYVKRFMKKEAECVRQVENWSIYEPHHKMDNPLFDKQRVKKDLEIVAPKMEELLRHIEELDAADMKKFNKHFKHMIFSDLKAAGGAKAIGAALLSHNYTMVYDKSLEIIESEKKTDKTFAILCSTKIYNKDVGIRFRRKILDMFNKRPDNIHGEKLRFIVLDYGFKEGIDLFDIKYVHIMETPITKADQKQIIGRGTRFCGQSGLTFDKTNGWPLYVYTYKTMLPEGSEVDDQSETMFDLFMKYSNIDVSKQSFAKELEKKCIQSSIDFELNKNIHSYGQDKDSDFMEIVKEVDSKYADQIVKFKQPKEIVEKVGVKIEKHGFFNCKNGCKGNVMIIPTELMLLIWYTYKPKITINDYITERKPRSVLCKELISNKEFCQKLQAVWKNPDQYIYNQRSKLEEQLNALTTNKYVNSQKKDILRFIQNSIDQLDLPPEPPKKIMDYLEMQSFMKLHYKKLKWPEVVMENKCEEKKDEKKENSDLTKIQFTPSQLALQEYFTPESAYKGLLVWHSTGTGKTCSGISIATKSFEKSGYTILWVTRSTLRGDIWKNMFKQVCSISLQQQKEKLDVEDALKHPLKYIHKNWIEPITYKQFSNLLTGKNEFYKEMVKRNGEKDPLRKTLIIIDEAHKLLSYDLKPQEKPNFEVLHKKILDSYEISKDDSVRLLLMTATPYSEDPMQMVKLLNLMRPRKDQFASNYDDFKKEYLTNDGLFTKPIDFLSKTSGYISYLNRETDIRQFAHPILKTIPVAMSESNKTEMVREMVQLEEQITDSMETIIANEGEKAKAKEKLKYEKKLLMDECKKVKGKEEKRLCREDIKQKEEEFKVLLFSEAEEVIKINQEKVKVLKKQVQEKKNALTNYRESDPSQERVLLEKCFKQELP